MKIIKVGNKYEASQKVWGGERIVYDNTPTRAMTRLLISLSKWRESDMWITFPKPKLK